jgi:hypothetical protein
VSTEAETATHAIQVEHVGLNITKDLAALALAAAEAFQRLPYKEAVKLQALMKAEVKPSQVTAKKVANLCSLVGFMFALELDKARQKRLAEIGVTTE